MDDKLGLKVLFALRNEKDILFIRSKSSDIRFKNKLILPGGTVENELIFDCVLREMNEEFQNVHNQSGRVLYNKIKFAGFIDAKGQRDFLFGLDEIYYTYQEMIYPRNIYFIFVVDCLDLNGIELTEDGLKESSEIILISREDVLENSEGKISIGERLRQLIVVS